MFTSYVTGANGFLGKHLLTSLEGEVLPIPHELIYATKLQDFHHFYFLSSYGNMHGQDDVEMTLKANLLDLIHMIREANKYQFDSFVYMSSSSVKLEVQTPYSRAKKAAEEVLLTYMEKYNLPICIIRPMSITGVGEQKAHLIPKLINSCFTGEEMDFVPGATHDFIDVDDVVAALQNLTDHKLHGIFELGWGKQYTNQQVLKLVEKITGKKANIHVVDSMRSYDNPKWVSTNFKSRSWGWLPTKSLEQSITEMVKDYENTIK